MQFHSRNKIVMLFGLTLFSVFPIATTSINNSSNAIGSRKLFPVPSIERFAPSQTFGAYGRSLPNLPLLPELVEAATNYDSLRGPDDGLDKAKSLVQVINQYRRIKGLDEIPYSPWLTYVARWHVYDLENNNPDRGGCNTHSWSNKGEGRWTQCCYHDGDARGCSWEKPKEISNGAYKGTGYEIACKYTDEMTNSVALDCWKKSSPHLDMMLNRGTWADNTWKAIGAGISYHYAVVWFAEDADTSR